MRLKLAGRYALLLIAFTAALTPLYSFLFVSRPYQLRERVPCLSYDPRYRFLKLTQAELSVIPPIDPKWIESDLEQISKYANCVRTYSVTGGLEHVVPIAEKLGMQVILGVAIYPTRQDNIEGINSAITLAGRHHNIKSIIVGNEVLLANHLRTRPRVPEEELLWAIEKVASQVDQPVSTAEVMKSWQYLKPMVEKSDFIALNRFPYWSEIPIDSVEEWLDSSLGEARVFAKGKPIFLSEIGWPTGGPTFGAAVPAGESFERFLEVLSNWSRKNGVEYNLFEAFDQPWKMILREGRVGSHWGIFDGRGNSKFGPNTSQTKWLIVSVTAAVVCSILVLLTLPALNLLAASYTILVVQLMVCLVCLTIKVAHYEYLLYSPIFLFLVIPAEFLLLILALIYQREAALVTGGIKFPSHDCPSLLVDAYRPLVSIHVATHNEPPQQVIETLHSLLALDYPAFEIVVIDNNTADKEVWLPVAEFCETQRKNIKFFHVDGLHGFKAGALNLALENTNPLAEVVAVVDADYKVSTDWLKDLVPLFADTSLAAVQAPQAHREWDGSVFTRMLRDEYEGFFHTGMVVRDADNALIQHGSMILMRKSALEEVGKWNTWSITEDTELGLRFLKHGLRIKYVLKNYGSGLVPADFRAYCIQRSRWVQGAMQILRRHRSIIFGIRSPLSFKQRYHFVAGWVPWISDILAPIFTILGLVLLGFLLYRPLYFPPKEFSYPIIFYVLLRECTVLLTYSRVVKVGVGRALLSSIASLSLTNTIARGVFRGLFTHSLKFERTNKGPFEKKRPNLIKFMKNRVDCLPGLILTLAAPVLIVRYGFVSVEAVCWSAALTLLGLAGFSIPVMSLLSTYRRNQPR